MHLTRYHGVFAPRHALRAAITPARRGRGTCRPDSEQPVPKHISMPWAQWLKRIFAIEIDTCRRCGGRLLVTSSFEHPTVIERNLEHRRQQAETEKPLPPFARDFGRLYKIP